MSSCLRVIPDTISLIVTTIFWYSVRFARLLTPTCCMSKKSVRDKKILITGSGSGIGRLLALKLGKLGARLILWDVNDQGNQETMRLIQTKGYEAKTYHVDLCSLDDINRVSEQVRQDFGKIDILINNAGIANGKMLLNCPDEAIVRAFAVNSMAPHFTVKNFLQPMLDDNDGHIVTVASMAGKMPSAGLIDYTSSKFAAVGFHDALAAEIGTYGKRGIKTTLICPYYINTPMFHAAGAKTRFPWLFPILEPEYVARKIVEAIQLNTEMLIMPRMFYVVAATVALMPSKVQENVASYFEIPQDIERFQFTRKNLQNF